MPCMFEIPTQGRRCIQEFSLLFPWVESAHMCIIVSKFPDFLHSYSRELLQSLIYFLSVWWFCELNAHNMLWSDHIIEFHIVWDSYITRFLHLFWFLWLLLYLRPRSVHRCIIVIAALHNITHFWDSCTNFVVPTFSVLEGLIYICVPFFPKQLAYLGQ